MRLTDDQFSEYLLAADSNQSNSIRILRSFLLECEPNLHESICTDKWFNGLIVFSMENGTMVYALGPRSGGKTTFHMMPYYCNATMQQRHGEALKKFMTGKSCLSCKDASELPFDALREIVTGGTANVQKALAALDESRKSKKKKS